MGQSWAEASQHPNRTAEGSEKVRAQFPKRTRRGEEGLGGQCNRAGRVMMTAKTDWEGRDLNH